MAITVRIGGKDYVAGMNWELVEPAKLDDFLESLRGELGPKGLVCHRKHKESISVGSAAEPGTEIAGASLALAIVDCHEQPWMGIFELPNEMYWYIAISKEQEIVSSSDKVGTRTEIEQLRAQYLGLGEWREILEGDAEDLEERLKEARKRHKPLYKVRRLQPERRGWLIPAVAVVLIGAGLLFWYHRHEQYVMAQRQELLAQQRRARLAQTQRQEHPIKGPVPWSLLPRMKTAIAQCQKTLLALPIDLNGWEPSRVTCTSSGAAIAWRRDDFGNAAGAPGTLGPDGNSAATFKRWRRQVTRGSITDALPYRKLMAAMFSIAQANFLRFTQATLAVPGAHPGGRSHPSPPYVKHVFTFRVDSLPEMFPFASVPTARIESVAISGLPEKQQISVQLAVWSK